MRIVAFGCCAYAYSALRVLDVNSTAHKSLLCSDCARFSSLHRRWERSRIVIVSSFLFARLNVNKFMCKYISMQMYNRHYCQLVEPVFFTISQRESARHQHRGSLSVEISWRRWLFFFLDFLKQIKTKLQSKHPLKQHNQQQP